MTVTRPLPLAAPKRPHAPVLLQGPDYSVSVSVLDSVAVAVGRPSASAFGPYGNVTGISCISTPAWTFSGAVTSPERWCHAWTV